MLVLGIEDHAHCAEVNLTSLVDAGAICERPLSLSPAFSTA